MWMTHLWLLIWFYQFKALAGAWKTAESEIPSFFLFLAALQVWHQQQQEEEAGESPWLCQGCHADLPTGRNLSSRCSDLCPLCPLTSCQCFPLSQTNQEPEVRADWLGSFWALKELTWRPNRGNSTNSISPLASLASWAFGTNVSTKSLCMKYTELLGLSLSGSGEFSLVYGYNVCGQEWSFTRKQQISLGVMFTPGWKGTEWSGGTKSYIHHMYPKHFIFKTSR